MSPSRIRLVPLCAWLLLCVPVLASAQSLGTFRWQLQPFCNVVTVNVIQQGGIYTLDGSDDQCGAAAHATVAGTAILNPNGSVGIGLRIVTAPSGQAVTISAAISMTTLSGQWRDSLGHAGTFAFNQHTTGSPRPDPGTDAYYVFPGHNFATGFALLVVPVPAAVAQRSAWSVSMTYEPLRRDYLIPGPGVGGATTYRVSVEPGATQATIFIDRAGPGEVYSAIKVLRTTR